MPREIVTVQLGQCGNQSVFSGYYMQDRAFNASFSGICLLAAPVCRAWNQQ